MKAEVRAALAKHGVARFVIKPVRRSYAFERPGVPHGLQWVLKVRYPASAPALPLDLAGAWPPLHLPSPVMRLQGRPARQAPWALHMPYEAPRPSQHAGAHPHDWPRTSWPVPCMAERPCACAGKAGRHHKTDRARDRSAGCHSMCPTRLAPHLLPASKRMAGQFTKA